MTNGPLAARALGDPRIVIGMARAARTGSHRTRRRAEGRLMCAAPAGLRRKCRDVFMLAPSLARVPGRARPRRVPGGGVAGVARGKKAAISSRDSTEWPVQGRVVSRYGTYSFLALRQPMI